MSELTYSEAAEYLGVSPATIQNWVRQGLLSNNSPKVLSQKELALFRNQLKNGRTDRLRSRANKRLAGRTFLPDEYMTAYPGKRINEMADRLRQLEYTDREILYSWFSRKTEESDLSIGVYLKREMDDWYRELGQPDLEELKNKIGKISMPEQRDTAGFIYQILQKEGRKSERGSYYTPPKIVDSIFDDFKGRWDSFLDPCCGTGIFLLAAAQHKNDPLAVEGWDNDPQAVRIARLNLMLAFPDQDFDPRIFFRNSLEYNEMGRFDLIATNPPWGHHFSREERTHLKTRFPGLTSGESFSYFLKTAMDILEEKGSLSFILPESILKVKTHRDIRKLILDEGKIRYLAYLGKPFRNVQTEVIRLDMDKSVTENPVIVDRTGERYPVMQERFRQNIHFLFDFNCSDRDYRIFRKLEEKEYYTLLDRAKWILGIVSGNNRKFLIKGNKAGYEPILSGKDISPFCLKKPGESIKLDIKILQQCAPLENYRLVPKIVYRFITGNPAFAIDREGLITLNSANSLYPQEDIQPETVVFFFNSSLYRFVLKKRFNSLKILREHLEQLPLPVLSSVEENRVKEFVRETEKAPGHSLPQLQALMDEWVFNFFKISHSDRKYIRENL